tara:strand:+ start:212 stop:520 length:309 start_codon:yes stop_codon:yes gene_type:complete
MCVCENNLLDLQQLKIYTIMAKYKALTNSQQFRYGGDKSITITQSSSQEELAFVYETLGQTKFVERTEKTNKTTKTDVKKVNKVKETNESEKESSKDKKDKE